MAQTILVADGDATTLELVTAVLTRDGFAVVATPDGGDALARFFEREPPLVLCAESLAGISGSELCRQIKAHRPETRVVILHPRASGIDGLGLAGELGCDAVLAPPFRYGELKKLLQQWQMLAQPDASSAGPADREFHLPPPAIFDLPPVATVPAAYVPMAMQPSPLASGTEEAALPLPIPLPQVTDAAPPADELPELEVEEVLPELVGEEIVDQGTRPAVLPEASGPASSGLDLPMEGQLEQVPLPRLLYRLYLTTFSGILHLHYSAATRAIYLSGGLPVHVASSNVTETLGRLLLEHGRITFEQYNESLALMQRNRCRQGDALMQLGVLGEVELLAALKQQVETKLINSFAWREGTYRLEPRTDFAGEKAGCEVQPLPAIWRGVHEHYELEGLLNFLVEHQASYMVATDLFAVHYETLGPLLRDLDLIRLLDGRTTFAQALQGETRALPLAQALYLLLVIDMIRPAFAPGTAVQLPAVANKPARVALDASALARLSEELAREHRRTKGCDYLDALRVDPTATPEEVDAAYANIVRALQLEHLPPGLSVETARLAKELHEALARARRVVRHPTLRDQYLLDQQAQFVGPQTPASESEATPGSEGPPPVVALDLDLGGDRTVSVQAQQAFLKGQGFLRAGQVDRACERFQAAISAAPSEPSYRVALAQGLLLTTGERIETARTQAVACLQQALQFDPGHLEANFEMAKLLHATGHRDRAFAYVQRVIQKQPTHPGARRLLASLG